MFLILTKNEAHVLMKCVLIKKSAPRLCQLFSKTVLMIKETGLPTMFYRKCLVDDLL